MQKLRQVPKPSQAIPSPFLFRRQKAQQALGRSRLEVEVEAEIEEKRRLQESILPGPVEAEVSGNQVRSMCLSMSHKEHSAIGTAEAI